MKKQLHSFSGKLTYDDFGLYQLVSPGGCVNISSLLSKIYYSPNNKIHIRIMNGCKILFNEESNLLLKKDNDGIYGYYVNGENLELVLFNSVDKDLTIEISSEALDTLGNGEIAYDRQESAK